MKFNQKAIDISTCATIKQAIRDAGLDWTVSKRRIYSFGLDADEEANEYMKEIADLQRKVRNLQARAKQRNESFSAREYLDTINEIYDRFDMLTFEGSDLLDIPRHYAVVKQTTEDGVILEQVLGVVGERYVPVQNIDAFDFFEPLLDYVELKQAGSYHSDKIVWIIASLKQAYRLEDGSTITPYLMLSNSHDGQKSLRLTLLPILNNSAILPIPFEARGRGFASALNIFHVSKGQAKLKDAQEMLASLRGRLDRAVEVYDSLRRAEANESDADDLYSRFFKGKTKDILLERFNNKPRNWLSACSVISEYYDDHSTSYDGIVFGQGAKLNLAAMNYVVKHLE